MKLIVGLGNPGSKYRGTRHNVGFEVVDELARRYAVSFESSPADAVMARERGPGARIIIAKPLTFMNRSGEAVSVLSRYYRIEPGDLLLVADDANLPLGRLRARACGSDGGHNGLGSVVAVLGTTFARLRVGVGRGDGRLDLANYVLARFNDAEHSEIVTAIQRAADAVETFVNEGIDVMMSRFNRKEEAEPDKGLTETS